MFIQELTGFVNFLLASCVPFGGKFGVAVTAVIDEGVFEGLVLHFLFLSWLVGGYGVEVQGWGPFGVEPPVFFVV